MISDLIEAFSRSSSQDRFAGSWDALAHNRCGLIIDAPDRNRACVKYADRAKAKADYLLLTYLDELV